MDILNIFFGIITLLAFSLSIYQYFRYKDKENAESIKNEKLLTRMEGVHQSLSLIYSTFDLIVQRGKVRESTNIQSAVTIEELQQIGRVGRAQASVLAHQLAIEHNRLISWEFGAKIASEIIEINEENPQPHE